MFRRAVRIMVESAERCLAQAGVDRRRRRPARAPPGQHPHHRRGLPAASGIPMPTGPPSCSTAPATPSSASIPLALVDAVDTGRLAAGDLVLLVGFGAGMTAASALVRWDGVEPAGRGQVSRVVLVTGGSRGIGLACARAFAAARRPGGGHLPRDRADRCRGRRACCACRATSPTPPRSTPPSPRSRPSSARSRCWSPTPASPTTCSCCAWTTTPSPAWSTPTSPAASGVAKRAVQKMMRARWGRIIFISSVVGSTGSGRPGQLRRVQGRAGRPGPLAGPRVRLPQHHRQRRGARARHHRDDRRARRRRARPPSPPPCPLGRFATPDEVAADRALPGLRRRRATSPAPSSPSTAASAWGHRDRYRRTGLTRARQIRHPAPTPRPTQRRATP